MRKLILAIAIAALTAPLALAAEPAAKSSSAQCKALQKSAPTMFGAGKSYKNLGACVRVKDAAAAVTASTAAKNAAKACKAERAMPEADFKTANGGKTFAETYGKNASDKNAYGKCVSQKAHEEAEARTAEKQQAELKAVKTCKAALKTPEADFKAANGGKTFAQKWGTNGNAKNAFGKCVSATAKAG